MDEATEAQKDNIICPKSHSKWQSSDSNSFLMTPTPLYSIMRPFVIPQTLTEHLLETATKPPVEDTTANMVA